MKKRTKKLLRRVGLSTISVERSGSGHSAIRRISAAAVLIALGTHQPRAAPSRQSPANRLLEAIGQLAANTQLADPAVVGAVLATKFHDAQDPGLTQPCRAHEFMPDPNFWFRSAPPATPLMTTVFPSLFNPNVTPHDVPITTVYFDYRVDRTPACHDIATPTDRFAVNLRFANISAYACISPAAVQAAFPDRKPPIGYYDWQPAFVAERAAHVQVSYAYGKIAGAKAACLDLVTLSQSHTGP